MNNNYFKRKTAAPFTLTDEQTARLERFEGAGKPFSTALDANYLRQMSHVDLDELLAVYEEAAGKPYPMNRGCGNCVLNFVRVMARAYRDAKEKGGDQ